MFPFHISFCVYLALPGDEHGGVVVSDAVVRDGVSVAAAAVLDGFLPLTETVQRLPSMMVDLQCWLEEKKGGNRKLRGTSGKIKLCILFC